jgi:hypothetical protein
LSKGPERTLEIATRTVERTLDFEQPYCHIITFGTAITLCHFDYSFDEFVDLGGHCRKLSLIGMHPSKLLAKKWKERMPKHPLFQRHEGGGSLSMCHACTPSRRSSGVPEYINTELTSAKFNRQHSHPIEVGRETFLSIAVPA